jgi:hypothetical protein
LAESRRIPYTGETRDRGEQSPSFSGEFAMNQGPFPQGGVVHSVLVSFHDNVGQEQRDQIVSQYQTLGRRDDRD